MFFLKLISLNEDVVLSPLSTLASTNYNWTKDGDVIAANVLVKGNTLYFTDVSKGNEGSYTCIASNENGATTATARLSLQGNVYISTQFLSRL